MKDINQLKPQNSKKRFYHFTRPIHLPSIVHRGIDRGEVPVTFLHAINFPWLTTNPEPLAISRILESMDQGSDVLPEHESKVGVRLEIEMDEHDSKLMRWQSYASQLRIRKEFYDRLTTIPRWGMEWHVYRGVIGFENVTGAYFPATGKTLTAEELKQRYGSGEQNIKITHAPVVWVTESSALSLKAKDFDLASDPIVVQLFMREANPPTTVGELRTFARRVKKHFVFARAA
jgi:hypothetical protein